MSSCKFSFPIKVRGFRRSKSKSVMPAADIYVGGISLVCPGQHRITVSAPT